MKNESAFAKKLDSLLKRIRKTEIDLPTEMDPIGQMVLGLLEWESTHVNARAVYDRLMERMVDYNDLRVSHPHEIKAILGHRYPKVDDRIDRILKTLQEIYIREHAVHLDGLLRKPKKEIRAYLDSLPGMPPYVAAQMTVLCFGGHAVPVDDVLVVLLRQEKAVDAEATIEQVESYLERHIRASDAVKTHASLRAWSDEKFVSVSGTSKGSKASKSTPKRQKKTATSSKSQTKKKTSRKAAKK